MSFEFGLMLAFGSYLKQQQTSGSWNSSEPRCDTAMHQDAGLAVDVGDGGLGGTGGAVAGIVCEQPVLGVELAHVDDIGPKFP
jgi:hypothetical protein